MERRVRDLIEAMIIQRIIDPECRSWSRSLRLAPKGRERSTARAPSTRCLIVASAKLRSPVEGSLTYGISEQLAELFGGNQGNSLGAEIARLALPAPNGQQPH